MKKQKIRKHMIIKLLLILIVSMTSVFAGSYSAYAYEEIVTITFDPNGGGGSVTNVDIPTGGKYTMPNLEDMGFTAPEGKEFDKWYVTVFGGNIKYMGDNNEGKYSGGDNLSVPELAVSMTARATWKDIYYNVTFEMNGAKEQEPTQSVKHGDAVKKPDTPSKAGSKFVNWYTDPSLEDEYLYDFNDPAPVTSDMTLYAGWGTDVAVYSYDVTNKKWGTDAGSVKVGESNWWFVMYKRSLYNRPVTIYATVDKPGYKFNGWSPAKSVDKPSGEIVNTDPEWTFTAEEGKQYGYFAMFEKYSITYDTRRGSILGPFYADDEGKAPKPTDPAVSGSNANFDNWYTDETFAEAFDFNEPLTADTTVYARWRVDTKAGIYDRSEKKENSGGKVKFKNDPEYYLRKQTDYALEGENVTILAQPADGYKFIGWAKDSTEGEIVSTETEYEFTAETNTTYYAVFDKKDSYSYISENGKKEVTEYTVLDKDTRSLTNGWYVVTEDTTTDHRLTVNGTDVNLLIPDGVTLNVPKGITVTDESGFNIWSESRGDDAGSLVIDDVQENFAGIGGENGSGGNITINGGHLTVKGGKGGAGIGASYGKAGGNITINGGNVAAYSDGGYGIGDGGSPANTGAVISLGYAALTDSIYSDSYSGTVTLKNTFADKDRASVNEAGVTVAEPGAVFPEQTIQDNSVIAGITLIPYDMGGNSGDDSKTTEKDSDENDKPSQTGALGSDTKVNSASTGDDDNAVVWLVLIAASLTAIVIAVGFGKRQRNR